jgi:hypothetical protein
VQLQTLQTRVKSASFWRLALNMIRAAMLPLALGVLVYLGWGARDLLRQLLATANVFYLALSLSFWVGAHFASPLFAAVVFSRKHRPLDYAAAFIIHARNLPARYLPGGVWHTVGRVVDFRGRGLTARQLSAFVLMENGLAAAFTLGVGGASVWVVQGFTGWGRIGAFCALAGLAGLILCWVVLHRWILKGDEKMLLARYAGCTAVTALFWTIAATAFVCYLRAFPEWEHATDWAQIGGIYLLAWGLGFIAVFAPQGVGVFEVVLASLLSGTLPLGAATVFIAGFRLVVLCADAVVYLLVRPLFSSAVSRARG